MKINIIDSNFAHHPNNSVAYKQHNEFFDWYRGNEVVSETVFFTDLCLHLVNKVKNVKRKIAWLLEPRAINAQMYEWIKTNNKKFDYVLTFDNELLKLGENYLFYPFGVTWIDNASKNDQFVKTKKISIIGSNKSMTPGHEFRKYIINHCINRGDVDVYGRGYKEIKNKEEGLNEYEFSIVLENSQTDFYFSEKIIDCFVTKTVPIYWGCDTGRFFNQNGILTFSNTEQLDNIIDRLDGLYINLQTAINDNYDRIFSNDLTIPEHWIYKNYNFLFK
jgi:hypothetical protein